MSFEASRVLPIRSREDTTPDSLNQFFTIVKVKASTMIAVANINKSRPSLVFAKKGTARRPAFIHKNELLHPTIAPTRTCSIVWNPSFTLSHVKKVPNGRSDATAKLK